MSIDASSAAWLCYFAELFQVMYVFEQPRISMDSAESVTKADDGCLVDRPRFSSSLWRPAAGADAAAEWCDRHVSGVAAAFPCKTSSYVT